MKAKIVLVVGLCVLFGSVAVRPAGAQFPHGFGPEWVAAKANAKDVVKAAKFAVEAQQEKLKADGQTEDLTLVKIVDTRKQYKKQGPKGMHYILLLRVKLGGIQQMIETTVWENESQNRTELTGWLLCDEKGNVLPPPPYHKARADGSAKAAAKRQPAKVLHTWHGVRPDNEFRTQPPANKMVAAGFVVDELDWGNLWTAWRGNERPPEVDFRTEMVLVATTSGPSQMSGKPTTDQKGNVELMATSTKMAGPGFGYLLVEIPRQNVKTVNGKPVPEAKEAPKSR